MNNGIVVIPFRADNESMLYFFPLCSSPGNYPLLRILIRRITRSSAPNRSINPLVTFLTKGNLASYKVVVGSKDGRANRLVWNGGTRRRLGQYFGLAKLQMRLLASLQASKDSTCFPLA